jgi:protein-S-isoprenylcysteine O-methyltransferase Ste14
MVVRAGGIAVLIAPTLLGELVVAGSFLMRRAPRRELGGFLPRLVAYANAFGMPAFLIGAALWQPSWIATTGNLSLRVAGLSVWMIGLAIALWPLWQLRHAFSIEPAARELVMSGPYAIVRHPIYCMYLLTYGALLLVRPTPMFAAAYLTWVGLLIVRIRLEERVLLQAFPEYAEYRSRVGALLPRLPRSTEIDSITGGGRS